MGDRQSKGKKTIEEAEPALAPAEIAFSDRLFKPSSNRNTYTVDPSGKLIVKNGDDEYVVTSDGNVYRKDSDGKLSEVKDGAEKNGILQTAAEAAESDDGARLFFDDPASPIGKMDAGHLDDSQAKAVGKEAGIKADDVRKLADAGFTTEEIIGIGKGPLTPSEAASLAEAGVPPSVIADASRDGSAKDLLTIIEKTDSAPKSPTIAPENYRNSETMDSKEDEQKKITPSIVGLGTNARQTQPQPAQSAYQAPSGFSYDPSSLASIGQTKDSYETMNGQDAKREFLSSFSGSASSGGYLGRHDLASGTVIPMTLVTGLNSDLPGQIVAQVSQNVYDTVSGKSLLVPKGTRLIATYDSSVTWGQTRALVAWTQMVRPDGFVLNLPGLPGIDKSGYAGYQDKTDSHIWSFLGAALLASVIDLGTEDIVSQAEDAGEDALAELLGSFTDTTVSAGQQYLKRIMDRQPTLKIRPGRQVTLLVTQTLTLDPYPGTGR
jgi:type IV secretory pathway VirB10-like protein